MLLCKKKSDIILEPVTAVGAVYMTTIEPVTIVVSLSPGGAGGKGTWGALGSELAEEEVDGAIDSNDPNYDEANPENRDFKLKVINLDRSDEELQVGMNVVIV